MKLKRTAFALILCIFALSGCVAGKETDSVIQAEAQGNSTRKKVEIVTTKEAIVNTETTYLDYDGGSGISWIATAVSEPVEGTIETTYKMTISADGEVLEKEKLAGKRKVTPAKPAVMQFGGSVSVGSEFFPRTTTYGVDCIGCSGQYSGVGGTAAGVKLSVSQGVLQPNGTWQSGIKYGDYYIVAADRSIPIGTVLEISNHGYNGFGLVSGQPFYAMVLDRGGGIWENHLDLYAGSEKIGGLHIDYSVHQPKAKIVSLGSGDKPF